MITGHGDVKTAVEAIKQGAANYLTKPIDMAELRAIVDKAAERLRLARANRELKRQLDEKFGFEGVIGNSPKMHEVIKHAEEHRPDQRHGADPGRNRHRQGTGRQGHPQQQPAQEQAVRGR